jgi:SAM-dependent methyltransferase
MPGSSEAVGEDEIKTQGKQWSRHAARYDEVFLDPFREEVENPIVRAIEAVEDPESKTVADLGCGTGPLLPMLSRRFGQVVALDFAPGMIARAKERAGGDARNVIFLKRPMHELEEYVDSFDVVVAVNSLVMPDVRLIDQTLSAIQKTLRPDGVFIGAVPAMDALHYQTMLLMDQALDRGDEPEAAERHAAVHCEHHYYDFAFGRFSYQGLRQKFWQPFEIGHRFRKAGFASVQLGQILYPWDESLPGGSEFVDHPKSWDWFFLAR